MQKSKQPRSWFEAIGWIDEVCTEEEYDHVDSVELLKDSYEITPIAELEDDLSRGRNDYRLVEATVSFSGVQNSKAETNLGRCFSKTNPPWLLMQLNLVKTCFWIVSLQPILRLALGSIPRFSHYAPRRFGGQWGLWALLRSHLA